MHVIWYIPRNLPDSKVHGANMGPTWVLLAPDGPHVAPMNLAIRVTHGSYFVFLVHQSFALLALCDGNPSEQADSPHKGPVMCKVCPCRDVIMVQSELQWGYIFNSNVVGYMAMLSLNLLIYWLLSPYQKTPQFSQHFISLRESIPQYLVLKAYKLPWMLFVLQGTMDSIYSWIGLKKISKSSGSQIK